MALTKGGISIEFGIIGGLSEELADEERERRRLETEIETDEKEK